MKKLLIGFLVFDIFFILAAFLYIRLNPHSSNNDKTSLNKPQLEIVSDIQGMNISLSDRNFLDQKLTETGFWTPNSVFHNKVQHVTVTSLTVHLVDQQIKGVGAYISSGTIPEAYGYSETFDSATGHLDLFIYINKDLLAKKTPDEIATLFSWTTLFAIYKLTHAVLKENNISEQINAQSEFASAVYQLPRKTFIVLNSNR